MLNKNLSTINMINNRVSPFLKWAGGKSQLLEEILPLIPESYGKYIEPFIGGGALFFAIKPGKAVISDSNPELINCYLQVAQDVKHVIDYLKVYRNTAEMFYAVRKQDWTSLSPAEAAARTIYLNKTCFNGLYRVNKNGEFNCPYGKYKNPNICDAEGLRAAAAVLKNAVILCEDYKTVLTRHAKVGDFVFLDPPYVPVSAFADFKRYTKEQFYEKDQRELAALVDSLKQKGVNVILTNSNAPLVNELYGNYPFKVVQTKRHISSKSDTRKGEDVIVTIRPKKLKCESANLAQIKKYPPTRFMGSKRKLLDDIWAQASRFNIDSAIDLFAGSGIVGYMMKANGLRVTSNDYMFMSYTFSKAMVENNSVRLSNDEILELMEPKYESDRFVEKTFKGLYFTDEENVLIDTLRANIARMENATKRTIAMSALIRACMKKRARGLFTYTGFGKYDDGRKDLKLSLRDQFLSNAELVNNAVFSNGKRNRAVCGDVMSLNAKGALVYIDPPYYSPFSDNEYVRRYHFVEGLARNWEGVEIQEHTQTKKFKNYPTPFSTKDGASSAFDKLFKKYSKSVLIVSYSSNSQPSQAEMVGIMLKYKQQVEVVPIDYTYSFGNQGDAATHRNRVQEYLFVGYNNDQLRGDS